MLFAEPNMLRYAGGQIAQDMNISPKNVSGRGCRPPSIYSGLSKLAVSIPSLISSISTEDPRFLYPHSISLSQALVGLMYNGEYEYTVKKRNETNLSFTFSLKFEIVACIEGALISRTTLSLLIHDILPSPQQLRVYFR